MYSIWSPSRASGREIREAAQDEYVLTADGQMFSAILRHRSPASPFPASLPPMRQIPIGARIRVTGICMLDDSNPFNAHVPFTILMRSYDDMVVVVRPSWLNVRNLICIVGGAPSAGNCSGAPGAGPSNRRYIARPLPWLSASRLKPPRSAATLSWNRGAAAYLEDITGSKPLAEILEGITEMVSIRLEGAPMLVRDCRRSDVGNCPQIPIVCASPAN